MEQKKKNNRYLFTSVLQDLIVVFLVFSLFGVLYKMLIAGKQTEDAKSENSAKECRETDSVLFCGSLL